MDNSYIDQLVDDIIDGNNVSAEEKFTNIIATKITDALDQRKQAVAAAIFNKEEDGTEE